MLARLLVWFALCASLPLPGQVRIRDDFDGTRLDSAKWCTPAGPATFFGRTQIRPRHLPPTVANGRLHLTLETYNPSARRPGDSFWGTEVQTTAFRRETGLSVKARVRVRANGVDASNRSVPLPGGLVVGIFLYTSDSCGSRLLSRRDEIDFELLSNDIVASRRRVLTNVFPNSPFSFPGVFRFVTQSGLDLTAWNDVEIRWLLDRTQWYLNGVLVREEFSALPTGDMTVRLNFWAPDSTFASAYSPALRPASFAAANTTWTCEVDWVEVCSLLDCALRGTPSANQLISFELRARSALDREPAVVLLSGGGGSALGGIAVVPGSDCRLMLAPDGLFGAWAALIPALGVTVLRAPSARTPWFRLPAGLGRGLSVHYSALSIGSRGGSAVASTRVFRTQ